jgi:hypothetical protein
MDKAQNPSDSDISLVFSVSVPFTVQFSGVYPLVQSAETAHFTTSRLTDAANRERSSQTEVNIEPRGPVRELPGTSSCHSAQLNTETTLPLPLDVENSS